MDQSHIRNFSIIAHIDHGKSTLADRFLELTGTIEKRKMREQYLDMHPLEREKGITIKMQPVRMVWRPHYAETPSSKNTISKHLEIEKFGNWKLSNSEFILNLIDTPGHVDFSYEVSRALAAVEGAVLLVDASQGIQAQTIANFNLAKKEDLVVIPAINKIDLPSSNIARTERELSDLLGVDASTILRISGKTGEGVEQLLQAIIERIPPPVTSADTICRHLSSADQPLRALIFDSLYDPYQGVIAYIRIVDGRIHRGENIRFFATGVYAEALEVGWFGPERQSAEQLFAGEIGYVATGIKEPALVRVGDTITNAKEQMTNDKSNQSAAGLGHSSFILQPLPGYREAMPMIWASVFPEDQDEYEILRDALAKLKLQDPALAFEPEDSQALGRGFRTGFLGMLHMEIVSERMKREYGLALVFTNPSVAFRVRIRNKKITGAGGSSDMWVTVYAASKMPEAHEIEEVQEPQALLEIVTPNEYIGPITGLIHEREGAITDSATIAGDRLLLKAKAPLREIIVDFYDDLKSISKGFASLAYELMGYERAEVVRCDILVAGEKQDAFAQMLPRKKAEMIARRRLEKLKELLPRQLFAVALQAEIEHRIIARETIPALKKDVTGYLYGGDRTRKMKLWKKQQRGKKRMKAEGRVEIPQEVFLKMLKR